MRRGNEPVTRDGVFVNVILALAALASIIGALLAFLAFLEARGTTAPGPEVPVTAPDGMGSIRFRLSGL